jgi:mRNA-degrading endonuclease RelE of RelBE toxin-antitoxin system
MNPRVAVGSLVREFIYSLAPEPRRKLWRGIKGLQDGRGDIKQLDGNLYPCWRLRVDNVRVIFVQKSVRGERVLFCFFADYRATVYKVVEQIIASGLIEELKN